MQIEEIRNVLKQLKAIGRERVSLSDLAVYIHTTNKALKQNLVVLKNYFKVEKTNRAIYISLK